MEPSRAQSRPSASAPPGPVAVSAPPFAARGHELGEDFTRWLTAWEFAKDAWLRRRPAEDSVREGSDEAFLGRTVRPAARGLWMPTEDDRQRVARALFEVLETDDQRDIATAAMIALAKIGREVAPFRLLPVLAARLESRDQEVRETASLALGIARRAGPPAIDLLIALAGDREQGRRALGRAKVDERTRAFAAYALGLAWRRGDLRDRARVHEALADCLAPGQPERRDLQVAAITALSLAPRGRGRDGAVFQQAVLKTLLDYHDRALGPGSQLIQAHVPTALARLAPAGHPDALHLRDRLAAELEARSRDRTSIHWTQSLALALGRMTGPVEDPRADGATIADLLLRTWRRHPDAQTRNFAMLSLGRIGGAEVERHLIAELGQARAGTELPWVALALGILERERRERGDDRLSLDRPAASALLRRFAEVRNPDSRAALAIALGLTKDRAASEPLRRALLEESSGGEPAGYFSIAVALSGDQSGVEDVRSVVTRFQRFPEVVRQGAYALGLLGDERVVPMLLRLLAEDRANLQRQSAIAIALGRIGDRRAIDSLLSMLRDREAPALRRAFAAAALGAIADEDPHPWNAVLADGVNYRASVPTLTDGASGVLDIL
ncbi:MAG: hypothetical protein Fur0037_18460 [Planctomycetota bacterium]